jgi:phasin family protein
MAGNGRGSRRKLPGAAVAPIPTTESVHAVVAMSAAEATIGLEAAHAASDIVLPAAPAIEAITVTKSTNIANIANIEDSIMDTTTIDQTAAQGQAQPHAMFTDVNDRAKGAMEKGTKFFAEMTEFNKGNVEALVESSKIIARGLETMGQDAAAYAKTSFEGATAAMRTMATVKSPTEFMKLQADYARQAFDAMVAQTSRSTEASLKLAGEVAQPISNRVALAADKMKIAA